MLCGQRRQGFSLQDLAPSLRPARSEGKFQAGAQELVRLGGLWLPTAPGRRALTPWEPLSPSLGLGWVAFVPTRRHQISQLYL